VAELKRAGLPEDGKVMRATVAPASSSTSR